MGTDFRVIGKMRPGHLEIETFRICSNADSVLPIKKKVYTRVRLPTS